MVLYRKYRPQKLSELDSETVKQRLKLIFSSPFIPHAFLFAGPKGTGKTSAARIIAKVLNCEKRKIKDDRVILGTSKARTPESQADSGQARMTTNIEPCNVCESCISITEGRHLDILEIDAASNRGIEEIRDLREKIKLAPVSAEFKVYIIDEVHMLTTEAFNALLKTLEEPPAHAIFILATTEADKLPDTIISRCIRINFNKAKEEEIIQSLKRIATGERKNIPLEVLNQIAGASDGSFRDATKLLEQAILENALSQEKISILMGKQNFSSVQFLKIIKSKDATIILNEIQRLNHTGINFRIVTEDLLKLLHDILLAKYNASDGKLSSEVENLLTKSEVINLAKLLSKVFIDLKNASLERLPFEIAMIEWCENKVKS